jgi:hypothetical protein
MDDRVLGGPSPSLSGADTSRVTGRWQLRADGPRSQRVAVLALRTWAAISFPATVGWLLGRSWGREVLAPASGLFCVLLLAGLVIERRERSRGGKGVT